MRDFDDDSAVFLAAIGLASAEQVVVDIKKISDQGEGEKIGTIVVLEERAGLFSFKVAVAGLSHA
jgi:hypothetical protein